ncbi:MAG: bifunctional 23S rRNA (guanine(2069)-N(7))-methyltransferase RlmK/23S rRNA (guanine(2445)-N(2))-methyltransferase RlmL [Desulfuromonas sp.]|nr:MAG: bifunctional 23S rRNA (guanine(2069)-N(7))-methyltransferase RlmK/23S rRNA (guanine(2445)-N(2))-methyltransferase RlmL [Desulfuromonas sp.]
MTQMSFFATAARGLEPLLVDELLSLGGAQVRETRAGVSFVGTLQQAYRTCLWSRLASRVLLPLHSFDAETPEQLYAGVRSLDWTTHLAVEGCFAVDCSVSHSQMTHSHFVALRVKDAIVDQFRERSGQRPSIELERPDIRLNLYLHRDRATLSLDLSGSSLHRRGYRLDGIHAPLKQNLAAAILIRSGWPQIVAAGGALIDPMCGSGTLPVEAALMATDSAPGLLRDYFGFQGWRQFDEQQWTALKDEAVQRQAEGLQRKVPSIAGYDTDSRAIRTAWQHARQAGLEKKIHFEKRALGAMVPPPGSTDGLLVANPPYGERLGDVEELRTTYNRLGERMAQAFNGWHAAIITSNNKLARSIGLRAEKINTLYNGALKCQLLQFDLNDENRWQSLAEGAGRKSAVRQLSPAAEMFANRIRKNLKKLKKWATRENVDCYRLYDSDLPEYAVAVDLYADHIHLQEYQPPKEIPPAKAEARLREAVAALQQVLEVDEDKIHVKVRRRQKGTSQYEQLGRSGELIEVCEGNARFLVNLSDYLDTGLFLDHRSTRRLLQEMAGGVRFLNLFGYTGAATVHAALGGARETTTVDMSRTYLDRAGKNLALNGFDGSEHHMVQADCLDWIESASPNYNLIFLDPPTFSNSKGMTGTFDVQRDHVALIRATVRLLSPGGVLIFSNNARTFKMDHEALSELELAEITKQTLPVDFERNPKIHNCWKIVRRCDDV